MRQGSTVNAAPFSARTSPAVSRRPPPPPPPMDDDDEELEVPTPSGPSSFQEIYRKYVGTEDQLRRPYRYGNATLAIMAPRADSTNTSAAASVASTSPRAGAAYKKYLAAPYPSEVKGSLQPPAPTPPRSPTSAAAPAMTSPARSVSEQSDRSTTSRTAATISKWRKVLYSGGSTAPPPTSEAGNDRAAAMEWELPDGGVDSPSRSPRSLSCVSTTTSQADARDIMEREERRVKRYFNKYDESTEKPVFDVSAARSFAERRRRIPPPVQSEGDESEKVLRCPSDGLVGEDTPRPPPPAGLKARPNANVEVLSKGYAKDARSSSNSRTGVVSEADHNAIALREETEVLQAEVQRTREKAEALARHLVRAMEEKRKLLEDLARAQQHLEEGRLLPPPQFEKQKEDVHATAGVQAALRTKERELALYEEEIGRLNGLVKMQQDKLQRSTGSPTVVMAAQAAAAAEVEAAMAELGVAHISQRKAEERAEQLASELESAVHTIYSLDGRVAELQKAAMVQQMEEMRAVSTVLSSPDTSKQGADEAALEQEALRALIQTTESLLNHSDVASHHRSSQMKSLQRTCLLLRQQLKEKGGEVEELQAQCTSLRKDRNLLRMYGAQWLQQLHDVKADADVIADIVRVSRIDAEGVVADSLQADSILATSISTQDEDSVVIRDYHSNSRHFAELVIHDMHAVARYLAALRQMNIGEREGYGMLEQLAHGHSPSLLMDEENDDEPQLPEAARQLVQQKRQFVLSAVEDALRVVPVSPQRHQHRRQCSADRLGSETEGDELIDPYFPGRAREGSPIPAESASGKGGAVSNGRPSGSSSQVRERSSTAKPTETRTRTYGLRTSSKKGEGDEYDEPSIPFFLSNTRTPSIAASAASEVSSTAQQREATQRREPVQQKEHQDGSTPRSSPRHEEPVQRAGSVSSRAPHHEAPARVQEMAQREGSTIQGSQEAHHEEPAQVQEREHREAPSQESRARHEDPASSNSGMGGWGSSSLPRLQSSRLSAASTEQKPAVAAPPHWKRGTAPAPTELPVEPQRRESIAFSSAIPVSPRASASVSDSPRRSATPLSTAAPSNVKTQSIGSPVHAAPALPPQETLNLEPRQATAVEELVSHASPPPTTLVARAPSSSGMGEDGPFMRRRELKPSSVGITDLPEPAAGNPFEQMSQPAEPPCAPGGSRSSAGIDRPRGSASSMQEASSGSERASPVEADRLPPRPFTKPIQRTPTQAAGGFTRPIGSVEVSNTGSASTPIKERPMNLSMDAAEAALTLSPIAAKQHRSSSVASNNSVLVSNSIDSSAMFHSAMDNEAQRKENVAKILERLRASKK